MRAAALSLLATTALLAQAPPDPTATMAAQRKAMAVLARLDGLWRGPASTVEPGGGRHAITQTERVGSFLDGCIKLIEGRGYEADGRVAFNAFAVVSYDPATQKYNLRSYARGRSGDFPLTPTADGFTWEIPAGPMTIRYTVVIQDGTWTEVGDRLQPGREPVRFFEMKLKRLGDTSWPAGDPVPAK